MNSSELISKRLLECINKSGLSYAKIAQITGLARSSIHRYAVGLTEKIPSDAIEKIACALDVNPAYILGFSPQNQENIINQYSLLNDKNQKIVNAVIRTLLEEQSGDE